MNFAALNDVTAGVFGEPVTIKRSGQPDVTVTGIFDSRHFEVVDGEVGASDLMTAVTVRVAEAGVVSAGDGVIVRGGSYRVWEPRIDGQGMVTLPLERV